MFRAEQTLASPVDDRCRRLTCFVHAGYQMKLRILEVAIAHQRGEVVEVGRNECRREPRRIIAERIGEQNQLPGQTLDLHALDSLAHSVDLDLSTDLHPVADLARSSAMLDVQVHVIDQIRGVEPRPINEQTVLVVSTRPRAGREQRARPHAQRREPPQTPLPAGMRPRRVTGATALVELPSTSHPRSISVGVMPSPLSVTTMAPPARSVSRSSIRHQVASASYEFLTSSTMPLSR